MKQSGQLALVLNAGSSSLKLAAFSEEQPVLRGAVNSTQFRLQDGFGREIHCAAQPGADYPSLLSRTLDILSKQLPGQSIAAVGHRVVHGGEQFLAPVRVTDQVLIDLDNLAPLAPLHQKQSVAQIQTMRHLLPCVPQIACFDTAFHATMPKHERMLGLPRAYFDKGLKRYGFHGLSYESVASRLPTIDRLAANGRTVVCHLGSGASLCALIGGRSIATTMGFTPLDGLPMATRAGTIDAGVVLYLLRNERLSPDQVERLLDQESGLLGVSGISAAMTDLLISPAPEAAEAVNLFCYRVAREVGAMVAALEGLDAIVFTGGIGEHAPLVRAKVCDRLGWLGVKLDPAANAAGLIRLSVTGSHVSILRIPTDEESVIARHALRAAADSNTLPPI